MTAPVLQSSVSSTGRTTFGAVTVANLLLAVMLLLLAMNFRQSWYYVAYVAFAIYFILGREHFKLDLGCTILFGFAVCLVIFWPDGRATYLNILKQLAFPLLYILGFNITGKQAGSAPGAPGSRESVALFFLAAMSLGCFAHLVLNYSINFGATSRYVVDYWTRQLLSATGQAAIACLPIGFFCGILFTNAKALEKTLSLAGLVVVLAYNLVLAGRTIVVMTIAVLVVAYLVRMSLSDAGRRWRSTIIVMLVAAACLYVFTTDAFGVRTMVLGSNLSSRFQDMGVGEDGRMAYKAQHLMLLPSYLWGGSNVLELTGGYAHDLLLDVFDAGGLPSFVFMAWFVALVLVRYVRLMANGAAGATTKVLFSTVLAALAIEFFVEPILYGMPWLLALFCFVGGMVSRMAADGQDVAAPLDTLGGVPL